MLEFEGLAFILQMGKLRPGGGWQSRVPSRLPKLTTFAPPTSSSLLRTEGRELDPFSQEADGAEGLGPWVHPVISSWEGAPRWALELQPRRIYRDL